MKTRYLNDQNTCVTQLEPRGAVKFVISTMAKIVICEFSVRISFPGLFFFPPFKLLKKKKNSYGIWENPV